MKKGREVRDLGVEVEMGLGIGLVCVLGVDRDEFKQLKLVIDSVFLLCIFSSKARRRASIKSAF